MGLLGIHRAALSSAPPRQFIATHPEFVLTMIGGREGARTADPLLAKQAEI
jgi:hypothetical protein